MVLPKKTTTKDSSEKSKNKEPEKRSESASRSSGRTKSPGRRKSPGKPKSPGRPKSPSRTKSDIATEKSTKTKSSELTKSPTRASSRTGHLTPTRRSPIRRSPSRSVKDKAKDSAIPVLSKKPKVAEIESDSDTADEKFEVKEKPKATVRGRTRTDLIEKVEYNTKESSVESSSSHLSKRASRSHPKEVERIVHLRHFETVSKKLSEFSDEDEVVREPSVPVKVNKLNYDYGGPLGVSLLMCSLPLLGFFLHFACDEKSCTFSKLPEGFQQSSDISSYFGWKVSLGFVFYMLYVAVFSAIPFGGLRITGLPNKHGKFVYITNGMFVAVLILLHVAALEYKHIPVVNLILDHQFKLFSTAFLIGVTLSVFAYVRSFYVPVSALNPHIVDKSKIYNFFMGRELHPRIFGIVDLKMFVYKLLFITEMIYAFAWMYRVFRSTENLEGLDEALSTRILRLEPTFVVLFLLQLLYAFDGLIFEHVWITSKEIQQEGFGYHTCVSYLIYPFMSSLSLKYVAEHNVQLAHWKLALIPLVYLTGYFISRASNNQKDAFRKNPYSPTFSHLETIPTTQGKKLLSSGFWGIVRHPNYLGNILMELSLVPFVLCVPPVLFRYLKVVSLVYRARRDNNHCKEKYGVAWDRYCNRVRYLLVPKVY